MTSSISQQVEETAPTRVKKPSPASARKALSVRAIETMKSNSPDKSDTEENIGLRVSCGSTGVKSFFYRYKSPTTGKTRQIKIGTYPATSLAQARVELARLKQLRNDGICPCEQAEEQAALALKAQKEAQKELEKPMTVGELVEIYLQEVIEDRMVKDKRTGTFKRIAGARKPKGQSEVRRTLHGDAVRVLGERPAAEVTRKEIVSMIQAIIKRGANVQAGNVLSELTAAYEYAIGTDRFEESFANPALAAKMSFKQAKVRLTSVAGRRVLSDDEIRKLLNWLPTSGFSYNQKGILLVTLWTGCRTGEVCGASWKDIDLDKGVWHLRDSKNKAERYVQLSNQCVDFIKNIQSRGGEYLFASERTKQPITQKTLSEAKWRLKNDDMVKNKGPLRPEQKWLTEIDDWCPHDLRRTVRTGLSRLGCPSEVAEAVLGHSIKGIEGTYNLHKYEAECKVWLQKWADHLSGLGSQKSPS